MNEMNENYVKVIFFHIKVRSYFTVEVCENLFAYV